MAKRKELEPWQQEDAKRLAAQWDEFKAANPKISQASFAAEHGLGTQGNLWQYVSGTIPLNIKAASAFARGFNVPLKTISPTLAAHVTDVGRPESIPMEQRIPVVGTAQAGDDGFWDELQFPTGHGDGFVRYPSRDPNAYALRIKGDSMRPRIKPGEFILVEPNSPLVPGEEVMVTTNDGRSMVKLLGPRREGTIEFHSINEDHRPFTIEESNIRSMHYVSAIVKSGRYYRDV